MSLSEDDDINAPLIGHPKEYSTYIRSTSLSGSFEPDSSEEEVRKKLQWYFKSPYEKYKERKRKPFKLILQVCKIILVTIQVFM